MQAPAGPSDKHLQMMKRGTPCAVTVTSETGKANPGEVRLQHWDKRERTRRAVRAWIYCWAISVVSIAIPIAHFFLVPGFFLAGPFAAWIVSTQGSAVLGGQTDCPDCGAFLPISAGADHWPLKDLCAACHHRITIERRI